MSDFKRIDDDVYVTGQITEADVEQAAKQGIVMILNNRPDGEASGQPAHESLAIKAQALGVEMRYIPLVSGAPIEAHMVEAYANALEEAEGPVLAFCRTGNRSSILWALARARQGALTTREIIEHGAEAGYDLSGIAPMIEQYAENA